MNQPAQQIAAPTALASRYAEVRALTERLCAPLSAEDQMVQSMPEASPAKWHRAHTTWFFETFVLKPQCPGYRPFHPQFEFLFNSYYQQVGERPERNSRGLFSRPSADEVTQYREQVDAAMLEWMCGGEVPLEVAALIELGLHHEQQHQELIATDIKHALWSNPLRPAYEAAAAPKPGANVPLRWSEVAGGIYDIGAPVVGFAFDNERPHHAVLLKDFAIANRLVTNAEYLQFIADGGYRNPLLWLSDGWDAVRMNGWQAPLYWQQRDGEWFAFTHAGMQPLDPQQPVCHVSYYEAEAYARWAGARLPTELEWEVAAAQASAEGSFLESLRFLPSPAGTEDPSQYFGEVWQWTASAYLPYPGYRAPAGAVGEYNGKFMVNQMVLRGASCATPRSHARLTYRNFFYPPARWQFSGIRLARAHA